MGDRTILGEEEELPETTLNEKRLKNENNQLK